ncbi:hypothetical protein H2200_003617 [Cladophialophora chaetospira]|uniref:Transmembrane protein n=1 Tax=Cladophialophora chaetospira TaxID=386627 RepID=A0AA39CKW7_9EURO|nr:hypothetical protein H2200_003617 [Cladophialophora chaetospira]
MDENPKQTDEHPLSEKQTNTDDDKLSVAVAAVTDPKFPLPQLGENSSTLEYVLSFGTLFLLLGGGIFGAWLYGVTMLQTSQPLLLLPAVFVVICGALAFGGLGGVNWWELVLGYWWLSMPIGALAGLALVMNQEASAGLDETS